MHLMQLTTSRELYGEITIDDNTICQLVSIRHADDILASAHCTHRRQTATA